MSAKRSGHRVIGSSGHPVLSPERRIVERIYQATMNLRDSHPMGYIPEFEKCYDRAYLKAFKNPQRTSKAYVEFLAVTRAYRALVRDSRYRETGP